MSRRHVSSDQMNGKLSDSTVQNTGPQAQRQQSRHPFLPTSLETILLSIYPTTLVLGSLFSTFAPFVQNASSTYSPIHQSYDPPEGAPSYFAQKRNVFNVYFVKLGWFWVTVALAAFVVTNPFFGILNSGGSSRGGYGPKTRWQATRRRFGVLVRWTIATVVWAAVTQWFFGPPLIDRSFILTGGVCEALESQTTAPLTPEDKVKRPILALSHAACRRAGGRWQGGHDISGHVFLLIMGSALLWMEVLPVLLHAHGLRQGRVVRRANGGLTWAGELIEESTDSTAAKEKEREIMEEQDKLVASLGVKFAIGVLALSWWMLLMTAAFFHTWLEKTTGLIVAFFGLFIIYFAPRGLPVLRKAIGMPGL